MPAQPDTRREKTLPQWAQMELHRLRTDLARTAAALEVAAERSGIAMVENRFSASAQHPMIDGILFRPNDGNSRVGVVGSIPVGKRAGEVRSPDYEFIRWNLEHSLDLGGRVLNMHYAGRGQLVVLPQVSNTIRIGVAYRPTDLMQP